MVLRELGLAAWHINGKDTFERNDKLSLQSLPGTLQKPVHVLVTVEVLGEGINIPNADTCMFVEPRNSYRSIIQAIGRVLRHHPAKTLGTYRPASCGDPELKISFRVPPSGFRNKEIKGEEQLNAREVMTVSNSNPQMHSRTPQESWE